MIGNPPYVRQEGLGEFKEYFLRVYETYGGTADLFVPFIEKGVMLLHEGGVFSYVVANKWMRANYGRNIRQWLQKHFVEEIVDFGDLPVFKSATTYPCIIRIVREAPRKTIEIANVATLDFFNLDEYLETIRFSLPVNYLDVAGWILIRPEKQDLLRKIRKNGVPLGEYVEGKTHYGIKTGLNAAFVIDRDTRERLIAEDPKSVEIIKPFVFGRDLGRYTDPLPKSFLIFTRRGVDIENYSAIHEYLSGYRDRLEPRPKNWNTGKWSGRKSGSYEWYEIQDTIAYHVEFEKPKIIYPEISRRGEFALDRDSNFSETTTYIIASNSHTLLGILNSKVFTFAFSSIAASIRGGYYRWKRQYMLDTPIPKLKRDTEHWDSEYEAMTHHVQRMLDLHKRLAEAKTGHDRTLLQRQIDATDAEIDRLVYDLYGLTDTEIKIVEDATTT